MVLQIRHHQHWRPWNKRECGCMEGKITVIKQKDVPFRLEASAQWISLVISTWTMVFLMYILVQINLMKLELGYHRSIYMSQGYLLFIIIMSIVYYMSTTVLSSLRYDLAWNQQGSDIYRGFLILIPQLDYGFVELLPRGSVLFF